MPEVTTAYATRAILAATAVYALRPQDAKEMVELLDRWKAYL